MHNIPLCPQRRSWEPKSHLDPRKRPTLPWYLDRLQCSHLMTFLYVGRPKGSAFPRPERNIQGHRTQLSLSQDYNSKFISSKHITHSASPGKFMWGLPSPSLRPQKEEIDSEVWNETKQEPPEWELGDPKRSTEKPCDYWMQSALTPSCPGWWEVILTGRELARWLWVFIKLYDLSCPDCLWLEHTKFSTISKKHHVLVEAYSRSGFWNQSRSSPGQKANVGSGPCWENLQCGLDSWVDQ